ncbi:daunorubicin ABC transporter ATP-binding protein [Ammoniphilus oxalaticus]|uniref:Daunorubicin ABC transporter ATP-binding protein n=1 Tax=Ammoniphilus oxalaticus TaxID=66863 RepID=A0A419SD39_9BACL|nr:ATP-binding cassette domain-containing protein [Ammoniphilus oxalaticus]RKD21016.1 daunorubicin ABC transporter ATP-binding protein [Ammoniphilus oxalaticus]
MQRIEVKNLTKEFKSYRSREGLVGAFRDLLAREYQTMRAVNEISFEVGQGEMVGYIGENGAGKSTTIKMLTGILQPTSGYLRVNGMDPHNEREKFVRTIGVVFGQRSQLWWDIAVQESFRLLKKVYRVPDAQYKQFMGEVVEILEIEKLLTRPVRKLSLGQRMRCELAAALIHNPPLLFLDEPTIGLDVLVKMKIREFLQELNRRYGTTVLLTTHDLGDIEALCPRVVMLDEGKIIYDGELKKLRENWGGGKSAVIEFDQPIALGDLQKYTEGISLEWKQENPIKYKAMFHSDQISVSDLLIRITPYVNVTDIRIEETSTEEIVQKIYQKGMSHV